MTSPKELPLFPQSIGNLANFDFFFFHGIFDLEDLGPLGDPSIYLECVGFYDYRVAVSLLCTKVPVSFDKVTHLKAMFRRTYDGIHELPIDEVTSSVCTYTAEAFHMPNE